MLKTSFILHCPSHCHNVLLLPLSKFTQCVATHVATLYSFTASSIFIATHVGTFFWHLYYNITLLQLTQSVFTGIGLREPMYLPCHINIKTKDVTQYCTICFYAQLARSFLLCSATYIWVPPRMVPWFYDRVRMDLHSRFTLGLHCSFWVVL